jgi:hypothetical protein
VSLPRNFYGPLVPTGELARLRRDRPGWSGGVYRVVEAPVILGEPTRTLAGCCWLERDGIPVHVRRAELLIEEAIVR